MNPRKLLSMLAVMALACGGLMYSQHLAHADDPGRSIPSVTATSSAPGEISVTWSAPSDQDTLKDYRLTYGVMNNGVGFTTYTAANSSTGGNVYPGRNATSYTITGLDAGVYGVQVRARYEDWENGAFRASGSVTVAGPPEASDVDTKDSGNRPRSPIPRQTATVTIIDDPTPEPQIAPQQSDLVDLTTLSNVVVSSINQAGSSSHQLNAGDEVAYRVGAIPNDHGNGDGYNITGIKIALSDFVRGTDGVTVRIIQEFNSLDSSGSLINIQPMSSLGTNPLIGYFSSSFDADTGVLSMSTASDIKFAGSAYPHCTVTRPGTPASTNNDCRNLDYSQFTRGQGFYVVIEATRGSFSVLHAGAGYGKQVAHDLDADLTWGISGSSYKRGPAGWQALTDSPAARMLVTAEKRSIVAATSPPTPVPTRPPAPSVSATSYRVGRWQSVDLDSTGGTDKASFGHGTYRVSLSRDTTYRIEFRTANTYTSADSFGAAVWFKNLAIDRGSALLGSPVYVYESKCSDATITDLDYCPLEDIVDDTTKPVFSTTKFAFNDTSLDAVFSDTRLVYHDFRTPAVLAANGAEHCNEESEYDDVACVYSYDYPRNYYLDAGLGFGSGGDYGRMQFRITRLSDQSLTGMTALREEGTCRGADMSSSTRITEECIPSSGLLDSFVLVAGTPANSINDTPAVTGEATKDDEIHFPGDVDWFSVHTPEDNECDFTAAGRDVGGNSASGLRMRIFALPGGALKAPSRGSLRRSIVNHSSDEESILEITGSRAGGYTITGNCSAPPPPPPPRVSSSSRVDDGDRTQFNYDDFKPSWTIRFVSPPIPPRPEPAFYGEIDVSRSRSRTADGAFEHYRDSDHFKVTTDGASRVEVVLSARSATVPAHMYGALSIPSTRLNPIDMSRASIAGVQCTNDGGVAPGTSPARSTEITISFSPATPRVGVAFTATLNDPGGQVSGTPTWLWSSSDSATGTFTEISEATSATYTPVAEDEGKYLRAKATFRSAPFFQFMTKVEVARFPVQTSVHTSPDFAKDTETLAVDEHANAGTAVGTVAAIDDDGDRLTYSVSGRDAAAFNEDFSLNASTGAITVKTGGSVDYDYRRSYTVTISVTDGEDSSGNDESTATTDDEVTVTINVTDVRETIPKNSMAWAPGTYALSGNIHSFSVDNKECFFIYVGAASSITKWTVGGYRLTVTDKGTPPPFSE